MRPVSFYSSGRWARLARFILLLALSLFSQAQAGVSGGLLSEPAANPAPPPVFAPAPPPVPTGPPPTQEVPPGVRTLVGPPVVLQNEHFEVDAPDNVSAHTVMNLALGLHTLMAKYLPWPTSPPSLIQVQLVPAAQADFTAPFIIQPQHDGHRLALVRWSADTKFADVCLALGWVSLESVVSWRDGPSAVDKAPDWMKLAFGKMLEARYKPAVLDAFSAQALQFPALTLSQIMTAHGPYGADLPILAINSFWLAKFLDEKCGTPVNDAKLFTALAFGGSPPDTLAATFPGEFEDPRGLELWWEVNYRGLIHERASPVLSMADSRALLDQMQFVDVPRPGDVALRTRLDDAWVSRKDKTVQAALATTILNARELPLKINPVYKNAALSLLRVMVDLSGDDDKAFHSDWTQYQADRTDGEAYEAGVEAAFK